MTVSSWPAEQLAGSAPGTARELGSVPYRRFEI